MKGIDFGHSCLFIEQLRIRNHTWILRMTNINFRNEDCKCSVEIGCMWACVYDITIQVILETWRVDIYMLSCGFKLATNFFGSKPNQIHVTTPNWKPNYNSILKPRKPNYKFEFYKYKIKQRIWSYKHKIWSYKQNITRSSFNCGKAYGPIV